MKKKRPSRQLRYQYAHPEIRLGRVTILLGPELKAEVVKAVEERGSTISGVARALFKKWVATGKI